MLRNYLKISIAVLLRRKFLTFVNLFGAVLTLTVLVVAFAIFESVVSPAGAQDRQNHILTIQRTVLTGQRGTMISGPGRPFFDEYIATLRTPDRISYATRPIATTSYLQGRKVTSQLRRTDAVYWQILDFDVLGGRLLSPDDIDQGRFVAVINQATAETFFPDQSAIGETIAAGSDTFEVVGVVANEPVTSLLAYADIWVPLTTAVTGRDDWIGNGMAMLYVDDPARLRAAQDEYAHALDSFVYSPDPDQFERAISPASTSLEMLASEIVGEVFRGRRGPDIESFAKNMVTRFMGLAAGVILLFMALPAINMANLNIGRILERASEIGLRKAAGASRGVLAGQFIFENVVLCVLGGLLAFAVAPLVLGVLNETVFTYGQLRLNVPVFLAGFAFMLIFGVLSGAYPAWKMARLEPAAALRGLQHA
jgi:putative ABC transport system permease protein